MANQYSGPPQAADNDAQGPGAPASSQHDPSQVSGQDPSSIFNIPLSYDTGLGGSPGQVGGNADATNEPGQYPAKETISGVPLDGTGLDGTQGAPDTIEQGGPAVMVTNPNNFAGNPGGVSGTVMTGVPTQVGGPNDSTTVSGQYPPAKPLVKGDFYPTEDGAGQGDVLVGGYKKGQRS